MRTCCIAISRPWRLGYHSDCSSVVHVHSTSDCRFIRTCTQHMCACGSWTLSFMTYTGMQDSSCGMQDSSCNIRRSLDSCCTCACLWVMGLLRQASIYGQRSSGQGPPSRCPCTLVLHMHAQIWAAVMVMQFALAGIIPDVLINI